jgi:hypothetical protein
MGLSVNLSVSACLKMQAPSGEMAFSPFVRLFPYQSCFDLNTKQPSSLNLGMSREWDPLVSQKRTHPCKRTIRKGPTPSVLSSMGIPMTTHLSSQADRIYQNQEEPGSFPPPSSSFPL